MGTSLFYNPKGHKWTASLCLKKDTGMRSICVLFDYICLEIMFSL